MGTSPLPSRSAGAASPVADWISPTALATAASLAIDQVSLAVSDALRQAGVTSILLKGPSIAQWLYGDGGFRPYGDTDLLVSQEDRDATHAVLESLDFVLGVTPTRPDPRLPPEMVWRRGGHDLDLHVQLLGVGAPPPVVWAELSKHTEPMPLAGGEVTILDETARTLLLPLHVANHGRHVAKVVEDLERGLKQVAMPVWTRAAQLARELDAVAAFAFGLRIVDDGAQMAATLDLPEIASFELELRREGDMSVAFGLERLHSTSGVGAKLGLLREKVVPAPVHMRANHPIAGRGLHGLAAGYAQRWLFLARAVVPAARARRRAHRRTK